METLSVLQIELLFVIYEDGNNLRYTGQLAKRVNKPGGATRQRLDALVKKGLIRQTPTSPYAFVPIPDLRLAVHAYRRRIL